MDLLIAVKSRAFELIWLDVLFLLCNLIDEKDTPSGYNKLWILFLLCFCAVVYRVRKFFLKEFVLTLVVTVLLFNYIYKSSIYFADHHYYNSWISVLQILLAEIYAFLHLKIGQKIGHINVKLMKNFNDHV